MTNKLSILIIDDFEDNKAANRARIQKAVEIAKPDGEVTLSQLPRETERDLIDKIEKMQPERPDLDRWAKELEFLKGYDAIFIDYQLKTLMEHAWLTAEDVVGMMRALGQVPMIAILNRFYEVDFDLSMAEGLDTAADIHINDHLLTYPGLWADPKKLAAQSEEFRPWMWPEMFRLVDDIRKCREELDAVDLDTKILDFFGFDQLKIEALSRTALGCLDPSSRTPEDATFKSYLEHGCLSIQSDFRRVLRNDLHNPATRSAAVRILVSELRRWLLWRVLAPQDALIDAPHLVQRMPWLLSGDINSVATWNGTVGFESPQHVHDDAVNEHRFAKAHWVSRPAMWLPGIQNSKKVDELFEKYTQVPDTQYVFLEDRSCFASIDRAIEFATAFNSVWATRFIGSEFTDGIRYAPKVRLI